MKAIIKVLFSEFTPSLIYINMPSAILIPTTKGNRELYDACITALEDLHIVSITFEHLLSTVDVVLALSEQTMPYSAIDLNETSKTQRAVINQTRADFVDKILQNINVDLSGETARYLFNEQDITVDVKKGLASQDIAYRQTWINGMNTRLARILETSVLRRPVALIATDPRRLTNDRLNPIIGLLTPDHQSLAFQAGQGLRMRKKADAVLLIDAMTLKEELVSVINNFTELRERDAALRSDLNAGRIKLEKQFERETWPGHALMTNVKKEVRRVVREVMEQNEILCDALDLEYQTLFRLTSLPISAVFENGDVLDAYLRKQNAYNYWRDILTLDPQKIAHPIRDFVIREIVEEQLLLIRERMQNTALPLNTLIQRQGIFSEPDWKLQKYGGKLAAIKVKTDEKGDEVVDTKQVTFKPVDINYAKELHSVLHYIHTPRAVKAFGLYIEDDPVPFSVVAFDTIDRPYKRDLLLMHGYNPSKCLDLARLYSRPGTPFNTSSTIFTLAFTYFKENEPEIQAILSAFMPTYAHGMSMISAGFNYGVLVKEWRHSFAERAINGQKTWELVTKRRKDDTQVLIDSQWPLLPVFELMANLQPPRFTPFRELNGMMISRNL